MSDLTLYMLVLVSLLIFGYATSRKRSVRARAKQFLLDTYIEIRKRKKMKDLLLKPYPDADTSGIDAAIVEIESICDNYTTAFGFSPEEIDELKGQAATAIIDS